MIEQCKSRREGRYHLYANYVVHGLFVGEYFRVLVHTLACVMMIIFREYRNPPNRFFGPRHRRQTIAEFGSSFLDRGAEIDQVIYLLSGQGATTCDL